VDAIADVDIRPAGTNDLPALTRTHGPRHRFAERLAKQENLLGMLLVAWIEDVPAGHIYIRLEPADEAELRDRLEGVPVLHHLEVLPAYRRHGIGTALLRAAERYLRRHGHDRVAVGVDLDNVKAAQLYTRLGYAEWPYPLLPTTSEVVLDDGRRVLVDDQCRVLVKTITAAR
jgi:GNAT superfamily N-acetyltransferase